MPETDSNLGSSQTDADAFSHALQPYESAPAQSNNQMNAMDESLHHAQNFHRHPPQAAASSIYQHGYLGSYGGNATEEPGNLSAQAFEGQSSNNPVNTLANSNNEWYRSNNYYGFDASDTSNTSMQQQFNAGNDIKPGHDLKGSAQADEGQPFYNRLSNSNNELYKSNDDNKFNANDASNTGMQNHMNTGAYSQNDANANYNVNNPLGEVVNDAFKTNSSQNSIGTWHSEKREASNASDSDSEIEVWTKPSSNPPTTSSLPQAPIQSNRYNSATLGSSSNALGSTASFLTSNLLGVSNPLSGTNYNSTMMHLFSQHIPVSIPDGHVPTWDHILPSNYFTSEHSSSSTGYGYGGYSRKRITLSLINVWEFTLEGEVPRAQIKKIAKDHVGKDGRMGALFERAGIVPDDPALKGNNNNGDNTLGGSSDDGYRGGGKWRIPLGAYQPLMTYLSSLGNTIVEGIPSNQLQAATLGRERFEKSYPTVDELVKRGVGKSVAHALAPYQRGGVEFILDKNGKALLADEMGLGTRLNSWLH
jgi:hypothetical protein